MNLVIIGLGGIGSHLLFPLMQYLNYGKEKIFEEIFLIDGDKYEPKNLNRQIISELDNKAISTTKYYRNIFNKLTFSFYDKYINKDNISKVIQDRDIILLCVDNNKTRMIVEDYSLNLDNITIISGGNELYDGNIMIIQKEEGNYLTPVFSEIHPEINDGTDKSPEEMSCEELAKSSPQISIVNATIADSMRRTLFAMLIGKIKYYETFINCKTGAVRNINFKDIDMSLTLQL